jgi:hypothetical protein
MGETLETSDIIRGLVRPERGGEALGGGGGGGLGSSASRPRTTSLAGAVG